MKKNINIRNIIIVMLCITIILMGLGFAFLASRLDDEKNKVDTFDVSTIFIPPVVYQPKRLYPGRSIFGNIL